VSKRSSRAGRRLARDRRARGSPVRDVSALERLVSVVGLEGVPARNPDGSTVGRVLDVVARWGAGVYPPVSGLVVRVGQRRVFVHAEQVRELASTLVVLASAQVDLHDVVRRPGEVLLRQDIVDHQLVDVDGARVVRAADLYLTSVSGGYRLVGVDVGVRTFFRRLGPARWRRRVMPGRVIDWADIASFSPPDAPVRLRSSHARLRELRPGELAELLSDLGRAERHQLLTALPPETSADVLEEMGPRQVSDLLRDAPRVEAADLVARMEPDEAVEALRNLDADDRAEILRVLASEPAAELIGLLEYSKREAGGVMTTRLVRLHASDVVADARAALRDARTHASDIDAVVVLDDHGRLLGDVPLLDLLVAAESVPVRELIGPPWPSTVPPHAPLDQVIRKLIGNRRSSLLVVDDDGQPLGRILADDILDTIVEDRDRRWPWQ